LSQTEREYSLYRQQARTAPTQQPYAAQVCRLMVATFVIHVIQMDHYSFTDPGEMEGWVGPVNWPIADTLPTKWSHVNHRAGIDWGKVLQPKTDVLTTEPLLITVYASFAAVADTAKKGLVAPGGNFGVAAL